MVTEVRRKCLTGQHITTMPLVSEDLDNATRCPFNIAEIRLATERNQCIRNLLRGVSVKIHIKGKLDRWGFLFVDDKVSVNIVGITEELGCQRYAVVKAHTK